MKRLRWLIIPLLATFLSGCPYAVQEFERAERVREQELWEEAHRRLQGRFRTQSLSEEFHLARVRVAAAEQNLGRARDEHARNHTPATADALQRAVAELRDAEEALRRAERAYEMEQAVYRRAFRIEVEAIREERERQAREREERMRGGNGGGD